MHKNAKITITKARQKPKKLLAKTIATCVYNVFTFIREAR